MENAARIPAEKIEETLNHYFRQYLVGDLKEPQLLEYIRSEELEVGISDYRKFTHDAPHLHALSSEFLYILEGEYHVRLLDGSQEMILRKGDFFALRPGIPYASKAVEGTRVLFVKSHAINDKQKVEPDDELNHWLLTIPEPPETEVKKTAEEDELSFDQISRLYEIHLNEWAHRDDIMWSVSFKLFFVSLVVTVLPYLTLHLNLELPLPEFLFPLFGFLFATYFLIVSLAYGIRLSASGKTIREINKMLPESLRRQPTEDQTFEFGKHPKHTIPLGKFRVLNLTIAYWTPAVMYIFLVVLAITVFVLTTIK